MSGGKGGSTSTSVEIPEYIEEAARRNLAKAEGISQIGYVPYYGPDVAAFTPFQQAGFQQTADVASAFGLGTPTTQADIMGGMPEPTEFAGGVRGYSAAPLYQQAVDELAAQRPAQAQYIESFFIDPVTGQAGTRVQPAVDYSTMGTIADIRAADRANELAIAQAQAAAGPQNVSYEMTSFAANPNLAVQPNDQIFNIAPPEVQIAQQIVATDPTNPDYNEAFQTVYDYQAAQAAQDPTGQSTGYGITPEMVDAAGVAAYLPPSNVQASTMITDPAEGITDTSEASTVQQVVDDIQEGVTGIAANTLLGQILLGDTYQVGGVNNPIESPTVTEMQEAAPAGMVYDTSTGGYERPDDVSAAPTQYQMVATGTDAAGNTTYSMQESAAATAPPKKPTSGDSGGDGGGGGGPLDTVLCSAYYSLGYLPREIWRLDQRYGVWLHRNDPELMEGYHAWAAPLAEYIQKDTRGAKVARAVMWPIVKSWAAEMAHRQRPEKHKSNVVGKMIMAIGEPFSRVCGMIKPRAIRGEA